jgi:hypothetical membrane protein
MALGGGLAVLAVAYFVASVVALHILCPTFDPTHRFLSEYALSEHGGWMIANFFVMAGGAFVLGGGLYCESRAAGRPWYGPHLLALCGLFLLLLGLFTTDWQEGPKSPIGVVHDVVSTLPFVCIGAAALLLLIRLKGDPLWGALHRPTLVLACVAGGMITLAYLVQFSLRWTGLIQRSAALPVLAWLLLVALRLFAAARRGGRKAAPASDAARSRS